MSASASALRGVYKWLTVESEIDIQKVTYWQKILRMSDERWPKACYMEMLSAPLPFHWHMVITEIQEKYNLSPLSYAEKSTWAKAFRQHIGKHTWNSWYQYVSEKPELKFFQPVFSDYAALDYTKCRYRRLSLLLRIGDCWAITRSQYMSECKRCHNQCNEWIMHILWDRPIPQAREARLTLQDKINLDGQDDQGKTKRAINSLDHSLLLLIGKIIEAWMSPVSK